jgi:uncharacterized membrane protein YkgB
MNIRTFDTELIHFFRRVSIPMARFGLFVIFFWFGLLKVIGLSPAGHLIQQLFEQTISFMPFALFYILFGIFEMVIGILFLVKGAERIVIPLLFLHMITTFGPLFFLPEVTWNGFLVPTLEGQYSIKNLALIACAVGIAAHLHPLPKQSEPR